MTRAIRFIATAAIIAQLPMGALPQQAQTPSASTRPFDPMAVMRSQGEVVAKGLNDVPTGKLKLKSYRLERVKLDERLFLGDGSTYDSAYRFVVTGQSFPLTATYLIWTDDRPFMAVPSQDGTEIIAVFLNGPNILEDGATLSVTEGGNPCVYKEGSESVLPEKLSVPLEMRATSLDSRHIRLRSAAPSHLTSGQAGVVIHITASQFTEDGRNNSPAIQIGKESFEAWGVLHEIEAQIPLDAFSRIPDNSLVIVKWGRCATGGEVVGRLNKSMLDR
jgi:hypothetical protein